MTRILLEHAKRTGLPPSELIRRLALKGKRLKKWGRLPHEYRPEADQSHPARGWKPESKE